MFAAAALESDGSPYRGSHAKGREAIIAYGKITHSRPRGRDDCETLRQAKDLAHTKARMLTAFGVHVEIVRRDITDEMQ